MEPRLRQPIALSLGANLGRRETALAMARYHLAAGGAVTLLKWSSLYETEPVEGPPQPWFLNQVLWIATNLPPGLLLAHCQRVETQLGRRRNIPRGPRTLDVDLLFYGDLQIQTPVLTLPHPALTRRRCVLAPLAELGIPWRHPVLGLAPAELLARCTDPGRVALFLPELDQ